MTHRQIKSLPVPYRVRRYLLVLDSQLLLLSVSNSISNGYMRYYGFDIERLESLKSFQPGVLIFDYACRIKLVMRIYEIGHRAVAKPSAFALHSQADG